MLLSILFVAAWIGVVYWRWLDWTYSSEMIFFDHKEGNPLFRDKWGRMSKMKALVFQVIGMALLFFLHFRVGPLGMLFDWFDSLAGEATMPRWLPLVIALGLNGLGWWLVQMHVKGRAESRQKQYIMLDDFAANYNAAMTKEQLLYEIPFLRNLRSNHGRHWFQGLPHIYVEGATNNDQAFERLVSTTNKVLTGFPRDRWFIQEFKG